MRRTLFYIFFIGINTLSTAQVEDIKTGPKTSEFTLSGDFTEIIKSDLDTLITGFQKHRVIEKITPFYMTMGNYGLPVMEIDFFRRTTDPENFLFRNYRPYMHHYDNVKFINTQVPFSELIFTFGTPRVTNEQTFSVRHSQNVNRYLNFGLDLDVIYSLGQYSYQSADNRSFTFHSSYTGRKYEFLGAFNLNNLTSNYNGGVENLDDLTVTETRNIAVKLGELNSSYSTLKNRSLVAVQKYTIGKSPNAQSVDTSSIASPGKGNGLKGVLSHIFILENNKRFFIDKSPLLGFYDTAYITNPTTNNIQTYDSLRSQMISNTVRFDFMTGDSSRFQIGLGVGLLNELNLYSQIVPTFDTLFSDTLNWNNSSSALIGKIYNRIGEKFGWEANGKLYIAGIRSGDLHLKGKLSKLFGTGEKQSELFGKAAFVNSSPSWWINNWGSNHFFWNNDFKKEIRLNIGGGYSYQAAKLDLSLDYSLITNYIYFNSAALPDQFDGSFSVLALRLNKNFRFWKFKSHNNLLLQQSSNSDILDLPLISVRSSFFFDHIFNFKSTGGRLDAQLGFEAIYNSPFYAYNFMPATSVFYNQNSMQSGNYPYLNVFANLKLKRTRFFFTFEHVNSGLMGNDYYIIPDYPMKVRTFKYGISWTFYN